jgi:NADPH:quinone reductase-like Zn-dependent oxidoreductase
MRAIVIKAYGGPEQLLMEELPEPTPAEGQVLIQVKAFGLNHAEIYFRKGIWGEVARISGIECVGLVEHDPTGRFVKGQKVIALMGGLGRTINGTYAEFTCVPWTNVVAVDSPLCWAELAALPESYATAWTCLRRNLRVEEGHVLLVRGGTSALGQAALNIASDMGVRTIATTRNPKRFTTVTAIGAEKALLEGTKLADHIREEFPRGIDAVLDLVGTRTLLDSLSAVRPDGRVCMAGFLGGGDSISFNPLLHMPSGVQLSFFASAFTYGNREYPLSDIPFQVLADRAAAGVYKAKPARVFRFTEIQEAHRLMESNQANGKLVVTV